MDYKSPILINDQSYEDYLLSQSIEAKLNDQTKRMIELNEGSSSLFRDGRKLDAIMTEKSNECKVCIDEDSKWCPTSTYASGYCCSGNDIPNCPRASMCTDEFSHIDLKYMLCPNEVGCLFSRNMAPPISGKEKLYEQITGTFLKDDICTFKITIPQSTDLNDMMYVKIEYMNAAEGTLVKGSNLVDAKTLSKVKAG